MAININKPTKLYGVNPPTIVLTGEAQDIDSGTVNNGKTTISIGENNITQNGLSVKHRRGMLYRDEVLVTLVPDPDFHEEDYNLANYNTIPYNEVTKSTNTVIGKNVADGASDTGPYNGGTIVNKNSNTYYTLNGKDPNRTKSNLYTGPFTIRRNTSGTDNTILKTRTYIQGNISAVRTVEIRIAPGSEVDRI